MANEFNPAAVVQVTPDPLPSPAPRPFDAAAVVVTVSPCTCVSGYADRADCPNCRANDALVNVARAEYDFRLDEQRRAHARLVEEAATLGFMVIRNATPASLDGQQAVVTELDARHTAAMDAALDAKIQLAAARAHAGGQQ